MSSDSPYDFAPERKAPAEDSPPIPSTTPPAPSAPPTPPQPLAQRLCPQCGFRIIGKPRQNRCPECRAQLDDSPADLLHLASSAWLRQISFGPLLLALAVILHVAGILILMIKHSPSLGVTLHLLAAALTFLGIWILTLSPEPSPPQRPFSAAAARWLSLSAIILWIGATVAAAKNPAADVWLMLPALILMTAESAALGLFASSLASRIPHDGLTNQLRNFAFFLPPFFAVIIIGLFFNLADYYAIFFCSLPLIGALLGLMAWATLTLLRLFLELRHVATAAEAISQKHHLAAQPPPVP